MKTMKKIVAILAVALMLCSILPLSVFAADNVADLNTLATNTSYTTRTTTAGWVATNAATAKSTMTSQNVSVILNGKKTAKGTLTSPTLSDGISKLSFDYGYSYSESKGVNATINIKNTAGNVVATDNLVVSSITQNKAYTYSWTLPTAVTGDFVIEILNNGPSNSTSNKDRLSIWNVTWVSAASEPSDCEHANAVYTHDCQPTVCPDCTETLPAKADHSYNENVTLAPTCTTAGEKTLTCACGDVTTETVAAPGHNFVDGACDVCGEEEPNEVKYTFSDYTAGTQYAKNEEHKLDNVVTMTTTDCHFTSELRIYSSSTNNGYAVITSTKPIVSITLNAGNKVDTLNLYYSESATAADATISVTATSYKDYTVDIPAGTQYIKLDVQGANQVRIKYMTLSFAAPSDCEHDYVSVETQAPTCTTKGVMTYTCSKCTDSYTEAIAVIAHSYVEDIIDATCTTTGTKTYECSVCFDSYDETIPMKAHNYVDDVCADCGHVKVYKGTLVFDADKENRTKYSTEIQVWEQNGVKLTNNKASSTTNIGDYANPGRFYKSSQIIIEFSEKMSTLIIDANGKDVESDHLWDATLTAAELSFTVENKIYTITFAEPVNSITLTTANQVRAYSITAIAAHECAYDNACDANCNKCGEGREVADHIYNNAFDTTCNECGAVRAVAGPLSGATKSISEDVHGYAVKFDCAAEGFGILPGTCVQADYTNATYKGHKLIGLGVVASNGVSETDIKGLRMYELENGVAKFAFRVINIPADKLGTTITMTPYYIVEIDGVETTIYGEAVSGSYAEIAG